MSPGPRRWRAELAAALLAGMMVLSRTHLSAHGLSDVVAGVLLGAALALGWPALLQELRARRHASRAAPPAAARPQPTEAA